MPNAQKIKPSLLYWLILALPALFLAWFISRLQNTIQAPSSSLPVLPDGRFEAHSCKPFIQPAAKPADISIAFTPEGPLPTSCLSVANAKICQAEQERLRQFIIHKAAINKAKLSSAREKARIKYESKIKQLEPLRKYDKAFVEQLELRLKELIIAEMALTVGLGNCAEFTAIQIALRLLQANSSTSLQRVSIEFPYPNGMKDTHVFLQEGRTICDAYNGQHGPSAVLSKQFVMYQAKPQKPATRKVTKIQPSLERPEKLPEALYLLAIGLERQARQGCIEALSNYAPSDK